MSALTSFEIGDFYTRFALSSPRADGAYMRQWAGLLLIQVMACRLVGAKPLLEAMLTYCQLYPWEQPSIKFWMKINIFINKMHL